VPEGRLRIGRRERLVDELHRHAVARLQPAGELFGEPGHRVLGSVGVFRPADDEALRMPFIHDAADGLEARLVRLGLDGAEGARDAGGGLPYCDSDAAAAEIEADERALHHACPASSERLAVFTPSECMAAS
jgi:hypothetical protein